MLIYSLIPARSGSKRIKDKNILIFKGKTLLELAIEQSLKTKKIKRTFVSTDSKKYQEISIKAGAECPYLRPKNISQDTSSDLQCFKHFLIKIRELNIKKPDIIVHLRPTYPTRSVELITLCINKFLSKKKIHSLRTIIKIKHNMQKMWFIDKKKMLYNPITSNNNEHSLPFQSLKTTYLQTNCVDIISVKNTIKKNSMTGKKIYGFETSHNFDIDDLEDFNKINQ
jgi:N-acylneuraminate cytidylyltransferase